MSICIVQKCLLVLHKIVKIAIVRLSDERRSHQTEITIGLSSLETVIYKIVNIVILIARLSDCRRSHQTEITIGLLSWEMWVSSAGAWRMIVSAVAVLVRKVEFIK
ncbi:hypothetical protein CEXT_158991 [Caerostris extrusa]|uniref:Uncharacterized protein n=1 Tax=Caerostris extrusa TaxID=172846 RepID=A0AAV4XNW9_CAEEX|nr:hypothetical protein CEXT_158991 [Caerostris extrusa]